MGLQEAILGDPAAFEGVDAIDWHALEHAYGPADDVPDVLRELLSTDPDTRAGAQWALYGNVYHQGTVYSATPVVVPILLKLLTDSTTPDRPWIVEYLAEVSLSVGNCEAYARWRGDSVPQEWLEPWRRAAAATYVAVREGLPLYLRLLEDADERLRRAAATALGRLREDAVTSSAALSVQLQHEERPSVRTALYLALADLAANPQVRRAGLTAAFHTEAVPVVRLQLAMRLLEDDSVEVADEPLACVIAAISPLVAMSAHAAGQAQAPAISSSSSATEESVRWAQSMALEVAQLRAVEGLYPNIQGIAEALQRVEAHRLRDAFPLLVEAMWTLERGDRPSSFVLQEVAKALLHIAFSRAAEAPEEPGTQERIHTRLTPMQEEAVQSITQCEALWRHRWRYNGDLRTLLAQVGLPDEREALLRFLSGQGAEGETRPDPKPRGSACRGC
jgi:hypothetical protein